MLVVKVVGRDEMTSTSIGWDGIPGGGKTDGREVGRESVREIIVRREP